MRKKLTSKFTLEGISAKIVPGIMSDPKRLEKAEKRIREATKEKSDEYYRSRRRAQEESYNRWLD